MVSDSSINHWCVTYSRAPACSLHSQPRLLLAFLNLLFGIRYGGCGSIRSDMIDQMNEAPPPWQLLTSMPFFPVVLLIFTTLDLVIGCIRHNPCNISNAFRCSEVDTWLSSDVQITFKTDAKA